MIKGSQALAMPINSFFGTWKYTSNVSEAKKLQRDLSNFQQYLSAQSLDEFIDLESFLKALNRGLYFDATIPTGYGLGSSGALCAGVLDQFGKHPKQLSMAQLKSLFSTMESYFHGASSGTDPLVCFLNHPILLGTEMKKVSLPPKAAKSSFTLFLLDTHHPRVASPFIQTFLKKWDDSDFANQCVAQLLPLVDEAIATFLAGQWSLLFQTLHELSLFQYRYFDFMILENFKNVWLEGLSSDHFKLKICGAGGGGFLLGISNNFAKTQKALEGYSIIPFF